MASLPLTANQSLLDALTTEGHYRAVALYAHETASTCAVLNVEQEHGEPDLELLLNATDLRVLRDRLDALLGETRHTAPF